MCSLKVIWSSLKAISSMNFSGESASEIKYNLIRDLSSTSVLVDHIHSL